MPSARVAKPRNSSPRSKAVKLKVDQEEDLKLKIYRKDENEEFEAGRMEIPLGLDLEPIGTRSLPASVKKDEPSEDSVKLKRDDEKRGLASNHAQKVHTKREVNLRLSLTQVWEHNSDGQRYIPRPSPARKKAEDAPDFNSGQDNVPPHDQDLPPSPPPQPSPQPQNQHHGADRALPQVEVLLPRLEDVRRQQAHARQERLQRQRAARENPIIIKPEPDDDVKPLLALEGHDPAEAREVLRTAVQNLRNPEAKVKKEMLLSDEFLLDALTWEGINYKYPIPLPKNIAEFRFSRKYISHLYGGNTQKTFPKPRPEILELHGLDDWMFLSLDFNPHAPTKPGHSGLFFSEEGRATTGRDTVYRTFVLVESGNWVYMGQYKRVPGITLSTDVWKKQKSSVRQAWTKGMLRAGWGVPNCIRIWFRKQHAADYELTKEDWAEGKARIKSIRGQLTEEDVIGAFDRGEEEMGTYRMTCVGYDAEFIEVLVRNVPGWVELEKQKALEKERQEKLGLGVQAKATRGQSKRKGRGMGSKRKPIEIESDSEPEDDDVKAKLEIGSDDSYQGTSAGLAGSLSLTSRPRRAAAMIKRPRTS